MFTYRLETMHGALMCQVRLRKVSGFALRCNTLAILNPIVNAVGMVCKTRRIIRKFIYILKVIRDAISIFYSKTNIFEFNLGLYMKKTALNYV